MRFSQLDKMQQQNLAQDTPQYFVITQSSKNQALLGWIGSLFFGFLAPLVLFLINPEDRLVRSHMRECLNLSINTYVIAFICLLTSFLVIPLFILAAISIMYLVFSVMGAIKASNGERFKVPVPIIRLLK